jgi:hypothetical protein
MPKGVYKRTPEMVLHIKEGIKKYRTPEQRKRLSRLGVLARKSNPDFALLQAKNGLLGAISRWSGHIKELAATRARRWHAENKQARKAHKAVHVALKHGDLKKGTCWCGEHKVDAHHARGYARPLDVEWLCRSHHKQVHTKTQRSVD